MRSMNRMGPLGVGVMDRVILAGRRLPLHDRIGDAILNT